MRDIFSDPTPEAESDRYILIEEVIRCPLLNPITLEPCLNGSLLIDTECLQSLDHLQLLIRHRKLIFFRLVVVLHHVACLARFLLLLLCAFLTIRFLFLHHLSVSSCLVGRASCIRLLAFSPGRLPFAFLFHLGCHLILLLVRGLSGDAFSHSGPITGSDSLTVVEQVIGRSLLIFTALEPRSDCSLFIEAETLQSLDHFELFLADADLVRSEGPSRRPCALHGRWVGHSLPHEVHEDGWIGRNSRVDFRLILLQVAHDTLIGNRVIAHLLEQLLIVLVGDHLQKRPFHLRRVPLRCLLLRCRSRLVGHLRGHLIVVAVQYERASAIQITICKLESLDAVFPGPGHHSHQCTHLLLCDAIRQCHHSGLITSRRILSQGLCRCLRYFLLFDLLLGCGCWLWDWFGLDSHEHDRVVFDDGEVTHSLCVVVHDFAHRD